MISPEEDEMYRVLPQILAADHIAELHREAERQRLVRSLRNGPRRPFRLPRPAGA